MHSGFDHNFGDLEESIIDRFAIEVPMTVKPKDVTVSWCLLVILLQGMKDSQSKESILNPLDVTTFKHRYDESNADDTLLLDSKNFVSVR